MRIDLSILGMIGLVKSTQNGPSINFIYITVTKMSDEPDIKESSSFIDLLERLITEEHFRYYEYSDFKNRQ